MKRAVKISLISVASFVGAILLTAGVAVWIIFTPARLTPIVQRYLDANLPCESSIGKADLTFFSTFPRFSVHIEDAVLDTVAGIGDLYAAVDVRRYLKRDEIAVDRISIDGLSANIFIDSTGRANYDFLFGADDVEENDTSAFTLPCELVDVREVAINGVNVSYRDLKGGMSANLSDLAADVTLKVRDNGKAAVSLSSLFDIYYTDSTGLEVNASRFSASAEVEADRFVLPWEWSSYLGGLKLSADSVSMFLPGKEPLDVKTAGLSLALDSLSVRSDTAGTALSLSLPRLRVKMGDCLYADGCSFSLQTDIAAGMRLDSLKLYSVGVKNGRFSLNRFAGALSGNCAFSADSTMNIAASLATDGMWRVSEVLALVPPRFLGALDGISFDGLAGLRASASGILSDKSLPDVRATLSFKEGNVSVKDVPYDLNDVEIDADAMVDLNHGTRIDAALRKVSARTMNSSVTVSGSVKDVLGKMACDLKANAGVFLPDLRPVIPDSLGLVLNGSTKASVKTAFLLDDVLENRFDKVKFSAGLAFDDLDASYADTLKLRSPHAELRVRTGAGNADGSLKARTRFIFDSMALSVGKELAFTADSLVLKLAGEDSGDTAANMIDRWNPSVDVNFRDGVLDMDAIGERVDIPAIVFNYHDDVLKIRRSGVRLGRSDFGLSGVVSNIWNYLNDKGSLLADLNFVSDTADVEHLLSLVSGIGSDETAEPARQAVPQDSAEAEPFMVPLGMDVTLKTRIGNAFMSNGTFDNVNGTLYVRDGTAMVEQMGFTSKAARMQLTALYRSPRKDHLYVGLDFHLLDIDIEQLINMIPAVDTIVPMLKSFKGQAEFHIAGETNLWGDYSLKMSTLRMASAIEGKNLVVLDSRTFDTIAKYLLFKKSTENVIDSLSVEMTVFRDEVDIYPFLISMDKYKVVAGGRHNLDMSFFYNLEVEAPVRLALDITGTFDDMHFDLVPCKYKMLFKPEKRTDRDEHVMKLKKMISDALKSSVKDETKNAVRATE